MIHGKAVSHLITAFCVTLLLTGCGLLAPSLGLQPDLVISLPFNYSISAAVDQSGDFYVSGVVLDQGSALACFSSDGTKRWQIAADEMVPMITLDGTIMGGYSENPDGGLIAYSPAGQERWSVALEGEYWGGRPTLDDEGGLFATAYGGLFGLSVDGSILWRYDLAPIWTPPAISPDGDILLGVLPGEIWRFSRSGEPRWHTSVPGEIRYASIAIGSDNSVYVTSTDTAGAHLSALNQDGRTLWRYDMPSPEATYGGPAIGPSDVVAVATERDRGKEEPGRLYLFESAGIVQWVVETPSIICGYPVFTQSGHVIVNTIHGFDQYDLQGALVNRYQDNSITVPGPPLVGVDGELVLPCPVDDGGVGVCELRLFNLGLGGLADSAWPRFLGNNQNSGRRR